MAAEYGMDYLGALPLNMQIRVQADSGKPTVVADPDGEIAGIYKAVARQVAIKIAPRPRTFQQVPEHQDLQGHLIPAPEGALRKTGFGRFFFAPGPLAGGVGVANTPTCRVGAQGVSARAVQNLTPPGRGFQLRRLLADRLGERSEDRALFRSPGAPPMPYRSSSRAAAWVYFFARHPLAPRLGGPMLAWSVAMALAGPARAATDLTALSLEQLMDIPVTGASKYEQKQSEVAAAVSVISREEIRAFGWRTLGQALASLPGVHTAYDRQYTYLGARGLGLPGDYNTRVLITINGNRVNEATYDSAMVGHAFPLDMDLVERIEYIPGPGSAVYGQNAMFGVVNLVTRSGQDVSGFELSAARQTTHLASQRPAVGGTTAGRRHRCVGVPVRAGRPRRGPPLRLRRQCDGARGPAWTVSATRNCTPGSRGGRGPST
jgi:hypothetical protein